MRFGNLVIFKPNLKRLAGMITGYVSPDRDPNLPQKKVEGDLSIGSDLAASTRIGNVRENQEDAVLIIKNGENPKYRMMVVADGVGGSLEGERASDICVTELKDWFKTLSVDDFKNEQFIITQLGRRLDFINFKINKIANGAETTLVCAIVAENNTYIFSIGDSRAYMVNGNEFLQISRDDSIAQLYYEKGVIANKDDMRFSKIGNQVTNSLGGNRLNVTPNVYGVPNDGYDAVLLFSDGVTDCLSDSQIFAITKKTSPKKIAQKIVQKALKTTSRRKARKDDLIKYYESIKAGKDNTTAAVMINKRKKGESHDER